MVLDDIGVCRYFSMCKLEKNALPVLVSLQDRSAEKPDDRLGKSVSALRILSPILREIISCKSYSKDLTGVSG